MRLIEDIRNSRRPSRTVLAHHEAGHAVLQTILLSPPPTVSIRPRGASGRRSELRIPPALAGLVLALPDGQRALALVALAGFAAEELLLERRSRVFGLRLWSAAMRPVDRESGLISEPDQFLAARMLGRLGHHSILDRRRELGLHYVETRAALRRTWPAVQAVANALDEASELNSEAFSNVIRPFIPRPPIGGTSDER